MGKQEIIIAMFVAVAGGLLLDLVKNGLAVTKKLFKKVAALLPRRFHLRKRSRLLVFLSSGGTCRDPIAKAITERVLQGLSLPFKVRIEAMALGPLSNDCASYGARNAIKEIYGEDLLIRHSPTRATREILDEADLVLVMDQSLMMSRKTLPPQKSYLLKEFFGLSGDVIDPWPDGKDQATLSRYRECAEEMKSIIEGNADRLIQALQV